MRFTKWLALAFSAAVTTSCGENSTEGTSESDTSTVNTSTVDRTDNTSVAVPEPTRTAFETKYPNASNVTWRRYEPVNTIEWDWTGWPVLDTGDYSVNYTWDGMEYWTWYDENNNWVGTVSSVTDHASLPSAVNQKIRAEYPGYTIVSVDRENDKDRTAYEVDLSKGEDKAKVLIAENGTVLKNKAVTGGVETKEKMDMN